MKDRLNALKREIMKDRIFLNLLDDERIKCISINREVTGLDLDDLLSALQINENITAISYDISKFSNSQNQYSRIISSLEQNQTLTFFDINSSAYTLNPGAKLNIAFTPPKFLQYNHKIVYLDLGNALIGPELGNILGYGLVGNEVIEYLDLNNNNLGHNGLEKIALSLGYNKSLKYLNLETNAIQSVGARYLHNFLQKNSSLTDLNLANNAIGDGVQSIANAFRENSILKCLNISQNNITSQLSTYVGQIIIKNRDIQELDLSKNNFYIEGAIDIINGLLQNHSLKVLKINNCNISSVISGNKHLFEQFNNILEEFLSTNTCLQNLDLSNSSNLLVKPIACGINFNNHITSLKLVGMNLSSQYSLFFAKIFENNKTLQKLDLTGNNLGYEGFIMLAASLKDSAVTHLNISSNNLTDKAYEAISLALGNIIYYNLSGNNLGTKTASELAKVLAEDKNLTYLDLSQNYQMTSCLNLVTEALSRNTYIKYLGLAQLNLNASNLSPILKPLESNISIAVMDFSGNNLPNHQQVNQAFVSLFNNNTSISKLIFNSTQHPPILLTILQEQDNSLLGISSNISAQNFSSALLAKLYINQTLLEEIDSNGVEKYTKIQINKSLDYNDIAADLNKLVNYIYSHKGEEFLQPELSESPVLYKTKIEYLKMLEELKSYINDSSTSLGITDPALHINPLGVIDYIADEFFY